MVLQHQVSGPGRSLHIEKMVATSLCIHCSKKSNVPISFSRFHDLYILFINLYIKVTVC